MHVKNVLKVSLALVSSLSIAAPWNNGIEVGTSVAQSYGSRNLFTNPAAIAFERELNGSGLLSSFTYGSTFNQESEFSLSSTYQLFGFGYEKLLSERKNYSRYQFGLSSLLSPSLFWGTRLSTTSSSESSLSGHFAWDLGLQYRPLTFLSLGLTVSELNQSTINGVKFPTIYTLGVAIKPKDWLTLTSDLETPSNNFAKTVTVQTNLALEPIKGLVLTSGYQSDHRFQVGFQWDLSKASLYSMFQPSPKDGVRSNSNRFILGFQTSAKTQKTFMRPANELLITLNENLSDEGREGTFFSPNRLSLLDILQSIKEATENDSIKTIKLKLEAFPLGLAAAEEVAEILLKAKNNGKNVEVYLSSANTKEYLIASSANTIYLEPSGEISLLGARISKYFAKGTLDKLGVEGEFLAKGDYKSAPETFTRKESSAKSREATDHEIRQIEQGLLHILKRSRNVTPEQWKNWLQVAVMSSEEALKNKLIDKVGSFDEVNEGETNGLTYSPSTQFSSRALYLPNRIAVITASGNILNKKTRLLSLTGQSQITPDSLEPLFNKALSDPRTKSIVLRVSSPGGEVLASEQIANLVARAKKKKPVIISMGDYAASGGYFISAPGNKILADQLTLTGSIGVFLGKFNLGGLYRKLDVNKEIAGLSPFASIDSEHKAWTKDEKLIMQKRLNQYYGSFVDYVAKFRNISKETAEKAAQGRVWLGKESIDLKIVDKTGGLLDAIEVAKSESGETGPFVVYPVRESIGVIEAISEETLPGVSVNGLFDREVIQSLAKMAWIQQQKYLYLAPID